MTKENNKQDIDTSKTKRYAKLPALETWFYIVSWIVCYSWAVIQVFYISQSHKKKFYTLGFLDQGWISFFNTYKDISDFEWSFWDKWLFKVIIQGFAGHFIVSRLSDKFYPQKRFQIAMMYGITYCFYFFGWFGVVYLMGHFSIQFLVAAVSKRPSLCWITALVLIYTLTMKRCTKFVKQFYEDEDVAYTLLFTTAMCNLRYIGFSLEYVWESRKLTNDKTSKDICKDNKNMSEHNKDINIRRRKVNSEETKEPKDVKIHGDERLPVSFMHLLMYQFYFPLCFGGPIITYDKFIQQTNLPPVKWNKSKTLHFILGCVRFAFWQLFLEVVLHYFYFSVIQYEYILLRKMPILALCGMALCQVQFFCMKYVVMYGFPSHFATSDNLTIPKGPHCVSSKHKFKEMWRYFDKGLHKWLIRYIFVPLGGSRGGIIRNTLSSILPFAFVFYWHGALYSQFIWAGLNWFGVYIESIAYKVSKTDLYKKIYCNFSPQTERRINGLFSSGLFSLLIVSNLYFLSGTAGGNIYMKRIYTEDLFSTIVIHIILYFGVQTSMEITRRFNF